MNTPQKPEPLPTDRYITRAERLAYNAALQDHIAAVRANEQKEREKNKPAEPVGPRTFTEEGYEAWKRSQWEAEQARQAEREAAEKAREQEVADYLASSPEVAEIREASEFMFMMRLQHWFSRGYEMRDDSITYFRPGIYAVRVYKPAKAGKITK